MLFLLRGFKFLGQRTFEVLSRRCVCGCVCVRCASPTLSPDAMSVQVHSAESGSHHLRWQLGAPDPPASRLAVLAVVCVPYTTTRYAASYYVPAPCPRHAQITYCCIQASRGEGCRRVGRHLTTVTASKDAVWVCMYCTWCFHLPQRCGRNCRQTA